LPPISATVLDIAYDDSSNVYVLGTLFGTADFEVGPGTYLVTGGTTTPITSPGLYFAKYNAEGILQFIRKIETNGGFVSYYAANSLLEPCSLLAFSIRLDESNNIYIAGVFGGMPDFDTGQDTAILSSTISTFPGYEFLTSDIFFAKYDSNGNYIFAKVLSGTGFSDY